MPPPPSSFGLFSCMKGYYKSPPVALPLSTAGVWPEIHHTVAASFPVTITFESTSAADEMARCEHGLRVMTEPFPAPATFRKVIPSWLPNVWRASACDHNKQQGVSPQHELFGPMDRSSLLGMPVAEGGNVATLPDAINTHHKQQILLSAMCWISVNDEDLWCYWNTGFSYIEKINST